MRKTTLHDPAEPSPSPPSSGTVPGPRTHAAHAARGRRARVRNRLLAGVLLTGVAVLAAGAPAIHAAYQKLNAGQELVDDAELGVRALALAHTLADERDALVVASAAADPARAAADALTDEDRARAETQIDGLRQDVPEALRGDLTSLPGIRERAATGEAGPGRTHDAYSGLIDQLGDLVLAASRPGPGQDTDPTAESLPELARAVDASAATRGLLLAALGGEGEQRELATLAHREAARESAALADFTAVATPEAADAYRRTVSGADAEAAQGYVDRLTARPFLTDEDRGLGQDEVGDALAARTDLQRQVLNTLAGDHLDALKDASSDHLIALWLRLLLVLAALALALGISVRTARSLTRPLAAVRIGSRRVAADPTGQQPVKYTGRNDEFAEVVSSVNALHARARELHERVTETERDTGGLRAERDRLLTEQQELSRRLTALHGAVHGMFAHHAQRLLGLVGEQLAVIERLEEHETDPDHLAVLFTLDHLAARMRRHGENLLLLAGSGPAGRPGEPLPLIDVLRAAVSEIERYELVEIEPPPGLRVVGHVARDLSHLLAELLDNATAFSPEGARVRLSGRWLEGGLTLQVEDEGIGLSPDRLAELNARLADPVTPPPGAEGGQEGDGSLHAAAGIGMGLYTVARLAARHRLRAWLGQRPGGGTVAEVVVPASLLTEMTDLGGMGMTTPPAGVPVQATAATAPPPEPRPLAPLAEHARADDVTPRAHARTESGLPLRTTGQTPIVGTRARAEGPTPARGVDAEELRRRLGGFQRGAREGHRDAAREAGSAAGEETTP
ncbi:sensor histidine kinase [Streptomyces sp. 6N223]|uniref:sensor histidine kinase n=1 Tax=Streptomyces sp. 6N223 TaxID=3457412 RepID=UPI003FD60D26